MNAFLFIVYSFVTFLVLIAGALFWYFKNINFSHEDLCEKGVAAFQKNDYEKARELFSISLADNPEYKEAKYNLGLTFVALKDYDKAIKCFQDILISEPDDFDARYNLGLVYFRIGDYANAKKCFEKILETDPREFNTLFNLALTYQMMGSFQEARDLYAKALQENGKDADCYFNLGLMAFDEKEYEKALELFEQANTLSFGRTEVMFSILRCRDELCKYESEEEGQVIINQYLKISKYPELPLEFDVYWARAYAKTGQIDKAFEICNRALVSLPNDALVYRILGLINLLKNELEEAKKSLLKAIDLDIYNPEGYNILSYVFLQQDNAVEYVTFKTKYKELIAENTVNAG